jgi:hypothetical protein
MKFTRTPPTQEGFYWCYINSIIFSTDNSSLEVGSVRKIRNGFLRSVNGAFDFDWGDLLYWGDPIESPSSVELEK